MKSWALIAALTLGPFTPAHAKATCETITDGIEYCTEAVLMVFSVQETLAKGSDGRPGAKITEVTQDHRAARAAALQDYRIGR